MVLDAASDGVMLSSGYF